jgi:choice-of-anchor A domain-containing protein
MPLADGNQHISTPFCRNLIMHLSIKLLATLVLAGGTGLASATPLEDYNLILFGDFAVSGGSGHIHGKAFIGGDLNGQNPDFGSGLSKSLTVDTLEVAGNLNANQVTVQAGHLAYGGVNNLGGINCNGNGLSGACLKAVSGLDGKAAGLFAELRAESTYYAGLASTGNVDLAGRHLSYTGAATDLAVFNLDGNDLFAQNSNWDLDFGAADKVMINVFGDVLASAGGINLNGGFSHANAENILWNFYDADSVDFGSTQWFGSVLALDAIVDLENDLNGTLAANSYVGNGQTHIAGWNATPPLATVPEPQTYLLMLMGLGFLGLRRFRQA